MSIVESIISVISPSCCIICNKQGDVLCLECLNTQVIRRKPACFWCNKLQPTGHTCNNCVSKTFLNGAVIPFRLDGYIKELIHQLKYNGDRQAGRYFAAVLAENLPNSQFDCITYVASTGPTQRHRGYNQSQIIAKVLSRAIGIPLCNTLLRKKHVDQIGLGRKQRLHSVIDNFVLSSNDVTNQKVLLIDDVMTTGATLNECARMLKQGGAKSVWAMVIAKK